MPQRVEFDGEVHEFPDDFTDADIEAALGGAAPQAAPEQSGSALSVGGPLAGLMAAAPGIVSGVNAAARAGGPALAGALKGRMGQAGMAGAALTAGTQLTRGDFSGAAATGAGAVAATQAPKAIGVLQKLTAPSVGLIRNPVGRFVTGSGRPAVLARGAGALSKAAGPVGVMSTLYDLLQGARGLAARDRQLPPDARAALEQQLAANNHQF
jgi:hypothetical protein